VFIAEFAETTGLTRDAVRFYVKHGLLRPSVASSGNRYQHFDEADIERVILIQSGQALGFTIRQIKGFSEEFETGKMDQARQIAVLSEQLAALEQQARTFNMMRGYLKKKIAWMKGGEVGPAPKLKLKGKTSSKTQRSVDQVDCLHSAAHGLLGADKVWAKNNRSLAMTRPRTAQRA
jgi:MerR family copper efflux transcriptional regulator